MTAKKKTNKFVISTKKPKRVVHEWSEYQKAIFREISGGQGNCMVIARAGSSKSSSLVEGAYHIPRGKSALFCAFSKSVAEELKGRLPPTVSARTTHSLGFGAVRNRFGNNVNVDEFKCWKIVEKLVGNPKENHDLIENICKTVSFSKANLVDTPKKIEELVDQYELDFCDLEPSEFCKLVIQTLRKCKEDTSCVDYDDQIWFCFVYGLRPGNFDFVLIDEAQDLNKAQIELCLSAVKKGGRIFAVLDDRQALFSWRGADSSVLQNLRDRLNPKELILPICYRCPRKVVELAQTLVPDIQVFEKAEEGEIIDLSINDLLKTIKPGSFLLSRFNAPLIKWTFKLLKAGIPANILGRDIGDGFLYLIKKSKKKTVESFLEWLTKWEKKERERVLTKNPRANTEFLTDKAECLRMLCEDVENLEEVKKNCKNLFGNGEEKNIVQAASIHRAKGGERDDVFILADTLNETTEEEKNCVYVAWTRSKSRLFLVRKPSKWAAYDDPKDGKKLMVRKGSKSQNRDFDERNLKSDDFDRSFEDQKDAHRDNWDLLED